MRLSGNGRSGSTRGSDAGSVRRCTGWGASPAAIPTCSSCGGRACGRRVECRSRMRRESHVRVWEGGGVQVPSATRLAALVGVIGHADRATPLRDYCTGLLMPAARKSVEPMAAIMAPTRVAAQHQSLLHFVGQAPWSDTAVLTKVRDLV